MKSSRGIKSVTLSCGARDSFEVVYYGPLATYRVNNGPRHWTLRPIATRKAGRFMADIVAAARSAK